MEPSDADVSQSLEKVTPATRRRDADTIIDQTGREGDAPAVAFAPRKTATTVYLPDGVGAHEDALARLGSHATGVGCLYLKNFDDVDLDTLEVIVESSFRTVTGGSFGSRADER